ncbi:MAG: ATP-binding cassette domain-containing protein [Clostridia bacterium]|nr:ATP-binding cassette domain-containing protein [Clostridia bacterium]
MENLILQTVDLSKKYKTVYAVKKVNMHIERGDIYGFVGENGAGKTTIIRLVTGLAAPTEGSFYLFGEERNKALKKHRMAGIVENVSLNRSMTALENLRYQCYICGIQKTDAELESLLCDVGLNPAEIAKRKIKNFSLGMRQRMGLASVMIEDPEFILLDEPMNGLDPQGFVEIREAILRLNKKGVTFLISSHILSELDKICNKIGFISGGELVEELSMGELHEKSRARIILTFAEEEEAKAAQEALASYPVFAGSECAGKAITVYGERDVNEILAILVEKKVRISSINVKEESVEEYYIEQLRRRHG